MLGLLHYDWPYNVRELEACIKRCCALAESDVISDALLPEAVREAIHDYGRAAAHSEAPSHGDGTLALLPRVSTRAMPSDAELRALLERNRGNVAAVGRELGKARMQIHRWMERYGIDIDDFR
jgi:DNA-binding NtrC family response regulator